MKASIANKRKYGPDHYQTIGRKGGMVKGVKKGFALMSKERLAEVGHKGGTNSKRSSVAASARSMRKARHAAMEAVRERFPIK